MNTTVLFHAGCPDGYAAMFACWQKFGNEAQYLPVFYGQPAPAIPNDHDLSAIAKRYGGGGHKDAAGFVTGRNWYGDSVEEP